MFKRASIYTKNKSEPKKTFSLEPHFGGEQPDEFTTSNASCIESIQGSDSIQNLCNSSAPIQEEGISATPQTIDFEQVEAKEDFAFTTIGTDVHTVAQGMSAQFMDAVDHIEQLAFGVRMDIETTVTSTVDFLEDNIHTFEETVSRYVLPTENFESQKIFQKLISEVYKSYRKFFEQCRDYITGYDKNDSNKSKVLLSQIKENDYPYDWISKVYFSIVGESEASRLKMNKFMHDWKCFTEEMCKFMKKLLTGDPDKFYEYKKSASKLSATVGTHIDDVFACIPFDKKKDHRELALEEELPTKFENDIHGIYGRLVKHISDIYHPDRIEAFPLAEHHNEVNNILKNIDEYCDSFGAGMGTRHDFKELMISFVNYCNSVQCATTQKQIDSLMNSEIDKSMPAIDKIAAGIFKTPPSAAPLPKAQLTVNWKNVHKKLVKMVAKTKKGLASARDSLYTYLGGKKMKVKFGIVHESILASVQVNSEHESQKSESEKRISWLSAQKEPRQHANKMAKFFSAYVISSEIANANIKDVISEASKVLSNQGRSKVFDSSKMRGMDEENKKKFHKKLGALKKLSEGPQSEQFIEAWYDVFRGGSLESLIMKFCQSYASNVESSIVFDMAKGIAATYISKLLTKKVFDEPRITAFTMLGLSLFQIATESTQLKKGIIADLQEALNVISNGESGFIFATTMPSQISSEISTKDVDNMAGRIFDFIESLAPFDDSKSRTQCLAVARDVAKDINSKSNVDKPMYFRNMARLGLGFIMKLTLHQSVPEKIKDSIKKSLTASLSRVTISSPAPKTNKTK
jgi:hypothetical protein